MSENFTDPTEVPGESQVKTVRPETVRPETVRPETVWPVSPGARCKHAISMGFKASIAIFVAALVAATFLWLQLGEHQAAIQIAKRVSLLGLLVFLASTASRWILVGKFGIQRHPQTGKIRASDWASFGFLLGLTLAGYITVERNVGSVTAQPGETLEIAGPTLDGAQFDLSQFRGKVVLIDFWATWCGPCVAELPRVKEVYQRYHDHGLEIVGVSFDQSTRDLKQFVDAESMPWTQIIFDDEKYQGFDNPNGVRYQINGIPEMMLADREGRLIARGMRGAEIGVEVRRALGMPPSWSEWFWALPLKILNWFVAAVLGARWYLLAACSLGLALVATLLEHQLRSRSPVTQ